MEASIEKEDDFTNTYCYFEGIDDMSQIEISEGEQVYACIICNNRFHQDAEIKKHIEENHSDIIIQTTNNLVERKEKKFNDDSMTTLSNQMITVKMMIMNMMRLSWLGLMKTGRALDK